MSFPNYIQKLQKNVLQHFRCLTITTSYESPG